ncbi:hypothetical protein [Streptomyces sp. NPDC001537]
MGELDGLEIIGSDEYRKRYGAEREPSLERINELFHEFLTAVARPKRNDAEPSTSACPAVTG